MKFCKSLPIHVFYISMLVVFVFGFQTSDAENKLKSVGNIEKMVESDDSVVIRITTYVSTKVMGRTFIIPQVDYLRLTNTEWEEIND